MEKIFCVECGCDEFVMKKYRRHYEGQGYDFYLDVEVPFCTKCGAEIDVEEIDLSNLYQVIFKIEKQ